MDHGRAWLVSVYLFWTLVASAAQPINSLDRRLYEPGAADVSQTWVVAETVVSFWSPGVPGLQGGALPSDALPVPVALVNGSFPGPALNLNKGQVVNITVINQLQTSTVTIHWHGIRQRGSPWSDGADQVTQCGIPPAGGAYSYVFMVDQAGTFFWHAHVGSLMDSGLVGQLVVRDPPGNDSQQQGILYDDDSLPAFIVQDWWRDPLDMLKANPAYNNFQNFEAALVNGYFTPVPNSVAALLPGPPGANSSSNGSSSNATAGPVTLQGFNTSFGYAPSSVLLLPLAPVTSLLMPTNTADMSNPFAMFKPYVVDLPSRGRCYRLRFINANGEAAGWQVSVVGHHLTVIAMDAQPLEPRTVQSFVFYAGQRVDAVLCADASSSPVAPTISDLTNTWLQFPVVFSSVSQLSPVCPWWPQRCQFRVQAVIRYPAVGGPTAPSQVNSAHLAAATGGAGEPLAVADVQRDPRVFIPAGGPPAVPPPTSSVTLALGFLNQRGPAGTKAFLSAGGHTPFEMPTFPALLSKLQCGKSPGTGIISVTDPSEVLEVVIENLTDMPHPVHRHGGAMVVMGSRFWTEAQWQGSWVSGPATGTSWCPAPGVPAHADAAGWVTNPVNYQRFWGCSFGNTTAERVAYLGRPQAALTAPGGSPSPQSSSSSSSSSSSNNWDVGAYVSDTVVVPPRSWAVVRLAPEEWSSGVWMIHCHTGHHMLRGMSVLLDVLPDQRPPLPDWLYSSLGGYGGGADVAAAAGAPGTARCGWGCFQSVLADVGHVGYSQAVHGISQGLPGPQQTGSSSTSAGLSYRASLALGLGLGVPLVAAIGALLWLTTHQSQPVMMASIPSVLVSQNELDQPNNGAALKSGTIGVVRGSEGGACVAGRMDSQAQLLGTGGAPSDAGKAVGAVLNV